MGVEAIDCRLGELLELLHVRRATTPQLRAHDLASEAGDLFAEFVEIAECEDALVGGGAATPTHIGPYEVQGRLGLGATGVVYRAVGPSGPVAVKLLRQGLRVAREAEQRLDREARIAASLADPAIVPLVDRGQHGGVPYLVYELVEGGTLTTLVQRCLRAPVAERPGVLAASNVPVVGHEDPGASYALTMAALLAPVALALGAAARQGIVHRDIKPANLLLDRGRLRIADFGLARLLGEEATRTIAVLGTPGFMSPEQRSGHSRGADARADVFGVGAVLAWCLDPRVSLTGSAASDEAVRRSHAIPAVLLEGLPRRLARVLERALAHDPAARYATGTELGKALARATRVGSRPRRLVLASAGVVLCATAGVATMAWTPAARVGTLFVEPMPHAQVSLDGAPFAGGAVAGGTRRVEVRQEGYAPYARDVTIDGGELRIRPHLEPLDPFNWAHVKRLARSRGKGDFDLALPLPAPEPAGHRPATQPLEDLLRTADPEALEHELARYPASIRHRLDARLAAIHHLFQAGRFVEAYVHARAVAEEHPDRRVAWTLCAEALWGLDRLDDMAYREAWERRATATR